MIDFKGVSIPLISLGVFEVRVSILARSCSDVKRFFRLCCLCAGGESSSAPRANTHRPAYVLAPIRASIRSVRGGNGQPLSMALQVPAPGISGPPWPASGLDKRWQICYNILWQIVWQSVWHLERQSAWRISSVYNRHSPLSDVHV